MDSPPTGIEGVKASIEEVKASVVQLLDLFQARLRYDTAKEEAVNRLTEQAKELAPEAQNAIKLPVLHDVILLKDSVHALRRSLGENESDQSAQFSQRLDVVLAEINEILERQDVFEWLPSGDRDADRRFRRTVRSVAAPAESDDGAIVEVVRPGYLIRGALLRQQEVVVAKHVPQRRPEGEG
jgi:molecular chaperone GrpE (heat shock protein)